MKSHQSGSVLAISLVLLTAITLIAIMGLQRSGLQTKIVANVQHKETVFHGAKNLLEDAYDFYQTADTQTLSDAIEVESNYRYQASIGTDLSTVEGPSLDINLGTSLNPHLTASTSVLYKSNGNDVGNPNTSGLRNDFSRGKNGMGVAKFELEAGVSLPNDMRSDQLLGFHLITPEQ